MGVTGQQTLQTLAPLVLPGDDARLGADAIPKGERRRRTVLRQRPAFQGSGGEPLHDLRAFVVAQRQA